MNIVARTVDSFQNFAARLGLGAGSQQDGANYSPDFLSRNRVKLEAMYRSSWIVGQAVDVVAEDMTRAGITVQAGLKPKQAKKINSAIEQMQIWDKVCDTIKWGRLYGGAVAVILIDGQNTKDELKIESISKGQFKGLLVLDRWLVQPSLNDLVTEMGPELGMPKFYDVLADSMGLQGRTIHHSRIIRIDGVDLPYWQRISENLWGQSVIERLLDRLVAYDSTTAGAAQLVYKAHLRTYKVKGLRTIIAAGGKAYEGLIKQMEHIRLWQSNEGLTVMDSDDTYETHQYSFSGLSDLMLQFAQQISGALQIPLVRLLGQSPAGMNSTGDSDFKNYYDGINQNQERRLRMPINKLMQILSWSVLGRALPEDFAFKFASLMQMSDNEKADYAVKIGGVISQAEEAGLISTQTAVKELKQSSEISGIFGQITEEDVNNAEDTPPPAPDDSESLATNDAEFSEIDNPREDDGKFAEVSGVSLTEKHTDPLPKDIIHTVALKEVLHKELVTAHGIDNPVVNKSTGGKMVFTKSGVNASLAKNGKNNEKDKLLRSVYLALPELFEHAVPATQHYEPNTKPDAKPGIAGYKNYLAKAVIDGVEHRIRIGVDVPHPRPDGTYPRDGAYYFHKMDILS